MKTVIGRFISNTVVVYEKKWLLTFWTWQPLWKIKEPDGPVKKG